MLKHSDNDNQIFLTRVQPQLYNAFLRALTLISRLALLFSLARLLTPDKVGLYGLFMASVTYAMLAVGLDFYTYSQREIIVRPRSERTGILLHHAGLSGLAYLVVLPVSSLVFAAGYLPWWMAPWFAILLILEHTAQEINRLLVATQRQLAAGIVLFIRQGLWVWAALMIMWQTPESRGLTLVFICWLAGCILAILLGARQLRQEIESPSAFCWDWRWAGRGLRVGLVFFAATLCLRGILTFDRYLFEDFAGLELLGVYTLYAGIAMALMNFIDATVFVFRFPPMVSAYQHADYDKYNKEWRRLIRHTIIVMVILIIPVAIFGYLAAVMVEKPVYLENMAVFWWLLSAMCLQALGMIPHYGLYAIRRDRPILTAHASGLAVFFIFAFALSSPWPDLGVPMSVAGAFGWILIFKLVAYRLASRRESRSDHTVLEKYP